MSLSPHVTVRVSTSARVGAAALVPAWKKGCCVCPSVFVSVSGRLVLSAPILNLILMDIKCWVTLMSEMRKRGMCVIPEGRRPQTEGLTAGVRPLHFLSGTLVMGCVCTHRVAGTLMQLEVWNVSLKVYVTGAEVDREGVDEHGNWPPGVVGQPGSVLDLPFSQINTHSPTPTHRLHSLLSLTHQRQPGPDSLPTPACLRARAHTHTHPV